MQKVLALGLVAIAIGVFALSAITAWAGDDKKGLLGTEEQTQDFSTELGYDVDNTPALELLVGNIVRQVLTFLGVIFFVLTVYAGYLWFTAGGNEDQITKAKGILKNGIIGLIIVFGSYAISFYVVDAIVSSVTSGSVQ